MRCTGARCAPLRGLLALDRVQFLENLDRDREIVLLELENRLGVVEENIRVEHERLYLCRNPDPRLSAVAPRVLSIIGVDML